MVAPSDYGKSYAMAQQELSELLAEKDRIERRILTVRKSLQTFAELCDDEGVDIERSTEADWLLQNTTLADEIRTILKAVYPGYLRPNTIKSDLEKLGRDLSQYQNPQATIQMVLKRMVASGDVQEAIVPEDGKRTYRSSIPPDLRMPHGVYMGRHRTYDSARSPKKLTRSFRPGTYVDVSKKK